MPVYRWSQTASTNGNADPTINFSEGQPPSSLNDSDRAQMAALKMWVDEISGVIATGGTSTAYTVASYSVFDTLAHLNGQMVAFTPHTTSGAAPTLAVDGLTAKPIRNATGVALPTGALLAGSIYCATYNNTSGEFLLHNQPGVLPASSVATATIADAAVTYAKIQNVGASKLLGNPTGSGAAPSEVSLGAGLSFSSSTLIANPAAAQNYLSGLTLSTAGSSTTMSIAAGVANDSTNTSFMTLAATSKTTASWAVGSGNGGLDSGSIANSTWYHFYVIMRPDTGVVDVLFSQNGSTPPTLPANYTLYRRIGSGRTNGSGQWVAFIQFGDDFLWLVPTADIATTSLGASPTTFGLTVPTGVRVIAQISGFFSNASVGVSLLVQSPDVTGAGPNGATGLITARVSVGSVGVPFVTTIRCNTFAQIVAYADAASSTMNVSTRGWTDIRGKI